MSASGSGRSDRRPAGGGRGGGTGRGARPDRVARSRIVAYEVLEAVRDSDAYANLLLPTRIERARLSEADAAFATELTYGTLRMQGFYDAVIALAAGRPTAQVDPPVLDVLRLGVHQLLATRVATHAAVNESVALARRVAPAAAGFVNAVLRTVSRREADAWRSLVADEAGAPDEALAAVHSHPVWVVRALRTALEREGRGEELVALLEADNAAPRVNLVSLPGLAEPPAELGEPDRYSPVGLTAPEPLRLVAEHEGRVRVQDEGSQLAALALSRVAPVRPGSGGSTCARVPAGRPRCSPPRRSPAARRSSRTRWFRPAPSSCAGRSPRCPRTFRSTSPTAATSIPPSAVLRRDSTASSSTRPAPASARCVGGPRPGGARRPRMSPS